MKRGNCHDVDRSTGVNPGKETLIVVSEFRDPRDRDSAGLEKPEPDPSWTLNKRTVIPKPERAGP